MSRGTAKILQIVNIFAMVVLILLFAKSEAAMLVIVVIASGISIGLNHFLRCPHCGAWPRKGSLFHTYCPRCGEPLE